MNQHAAVAIADAERQARSLLDLIEADRARQCGQIRDDANARAATTRAQARDQARAHLHQIFADQRQRRRDRLAAAEAGLATRRRLHEQRRTAALLQLAWQQLPGALRALWQHDVSRRAWVQHVVSYARDRLQPGSWRIVHAADWPEGERNELSSALAGARIELGFETDAAIDAGLRIVDGRNVVDGTVAGLLADRADIEARLLRELEARR
jgi:hypothetical protein